MEILCFYAGMVFFYSHSLYPFFLVVAALYFRANGLVVLWFLAAVLLSWFHQYLEADQRMPTERLIQSAVVEGQILSIPTDAIDKTQFQFLLTALNGQSVSALVLLRCYQHCPLFQTGQTWRFQVKLKRPDNLANPGGFDYAGFLNARHIHWTGYIKPGRMLLMSESVPLMNLLRIREKMAGQLSGTRLQGEETGIVQALALGITYRIKPALWELFRRTGTTHLMVISGAHIGLIAGLVFWLGNWLWRRSARLCLAYPAIQIASLIAFLAALVYGLLAGFGVPVQRALVACLFLPLRYLLNQRFTIWQGWRYGLFLVLLYEPHAVLMPGFYFSFLAVAILMIVSQRLPFQGIKKILCLQLACLLGLMPLGLYWFSYGALTGLFANVLAIPLVGYVIVPLSLFNLVLLQVFPTDFFIIPLGWAIKGLLWYLRFIDSFSLYNLHYSLSPLSAVFTLMIAMGLLLLFPIRAALPPILIMAIVVWFPYRERPPMGAAQIDILDVGQGLAVVVTTHQHTLIYDTGVQFYHGSDMGQLAVIPYLKAKGITQLDKVVISHPDLDHRGGLASIEKQYRIPELLVDNVSFYHRGKNCHTYPDWEWDGVQFSFLAIKPEFATRNNSSCVLKITNDVSSVLLTGDIEKGAEAYLRQTYPRQLQSTLVVIPHHGSKTSSTPDFIKQVAPHYAVISAGFDNRFHFPHPQTLETLKNAKVAILDTIHCGMIGFTLAPKGQTLKPFCFRHRI